MHEEPTEERYRIAVDVAPGGALLVREDGTIAHANDHAASIFDSEVHTLVGRNVDDLVPADVRTQHAGLRRGFLDAPSLRMMGTGRELWARTAKGRRVPVEVSLRPLDGLVFCTVADVSARRQEQERFRTALDAAPNAILMVNAAGTIVLCNRNCERVFGYERTAMVGEPIEALLPPEAAVRHREHRRVYGHDRRPRAMGAGRELQAVRADGRRFPVEVALQPVPLDDGEYVIASVVDISHRVESQRLIDTQHAELQERNRELRALTRSASHDLKGPLTTIVGLATSMLEDLETGKTEDVPRIAAWTRKIAKRTIQALENLRNVADAPVERHPRSRFALRRCLDEVATELEPLRRAGGVDIRVDVPEDLVLHTEKPRVASVLHHLIDNALLFKDPRVSNPWVEVRAQRSDEVLQMSVRDNGVGIPEELRDRVFDLFGRAHATDDAGPGIGLTLVRRHARQLGGTVRLEPGSVTTFVVELPWENVS